MKQNKEKEREKAPRCQPPRNFEPAGTVLWAEIHVNPPPFLNGVHERPRGLKAKGLRYEANGQKYLLQRYPDKYVPSPWLRFESAHNVASRWCQPDGLLLDIRALRLTIVEFKFKHTSNAWWQTRHLYEPVVRSLFPLIRDVRICEVVRFLDPATPFPETFNYAASIEDVARGGFGVHIWKD